MDEKRVRYFVNPKNGQIKRPPNAFMLFSNHIQPILKGKLARIEKQSYSLPRTIGVMWRLITKNQRRPFQERAQKLFRDHRRLFPNYVFKQKNVIKDSNSNHQESPAGRCPTPSPVLIWPHPGPTTPVRTPGPVLPPWSKRGRRPMPAVPKDEVPKSNVNDKPKIVIKDPTKVKFRIMPKYRPQKYICRQMREKKDEVRIPDIVQENQESRCSLDDISSPYGAINCDIDVDALLDQMGLLKSLCLDERSNPVQNEKNNTEWMDESTLSLNLSSLFHLDEEDDVPEPIQPSNDDWNTVDKHSTESNNPTFNHFSKSSEPPLSYNNDRTEELDWWGEFDFLCSPIMRASPSGPMSHIDGGFLPEDPLFGVSNRPTSTDIDEIKDLPDPNMPQVDVVVVNAPQNDQVDERFENGIELQSIIEFSDSQSSVVCYVTEQHGDLAEKVAAESESRDTTDNNPKDVLLMNVNDSTEQILTADAKPQEDSVLEFSYTTTPTWDSMVNLTPSIVTNCTTKIFTSSSGGSADRSHCNSLPTHSLLSSSQSSFLDGSTEGYIRSSTPIMQSCHDERMSPATSQLINSCLNEGASPYVSPFLANLANMTSPIGSNCSGSLADVSVQSDTMDTDIYHSGPSDTPRLNQTPKRKKNLSYVFDIGSHPIINLAPPTKQARRSTNQTCISPQSSYLPKQQNLLQYGRRCSPPTPKRTTKRLQGKSPRRFDGTASKRRRLPSITADEAQMMVSGIQMDDNCKASEVGNSQSIHSDLCISDVVETSNAVAALLKEHFG